MELQERLEYFKNNNIQVCAISYDSVEILKKFSDKFGITYPLLSDKQSNVIRRFGILNTNVPEEHPWYGVPYPGSFMVDAQGSVIEKSFYANHAIRDSVVRMLEDGFHVQNYGQKNCQTWKADGVTATACLSSRTFRPGQVLTFALEIEIDEGHHIYGYPIPDGYVPTRLTFQDMENIHFGEVAYPDPHPVYLNALGEELLVYRGLIALKASVICRRREGFVLRACLTYQACDERECFLPEKIEFELPLDYLDNVRD